MHYPLSWDFCPFIQMAIHFAFVNLNCHFNFCVYNLPFNTNNTQVSSQWCHGMLRVQCLSNPGVEAWSWVVCSSKPNNLLIYLSHCLIACNQIKNFWSEPIIEMNGRNPAFLWLIIQWLPVDAKMLRFSFCPSWLCLSTVKYKQD